MHFYTEGDQIALPADASYMFYLFYQLSDLSALSNWDSSNVTNMNNMFFSAGSFATSFSLDLSSWDTSSVTDMSLMFNSAGYSATSWSVTIPQTNGGGINNAIDRLYGQTTSTYAAPDSGKSFTLVQP